MTSQQEHATVFAELHIKGDPLILFNIWDAGSARALAEIGAKAIATGSWSVAAAHGYADGENLPLPLVIANLARIAASVDLPVTLDLESGYGQTPGEVKVVAEQVIAAGAIGINFEDQITDEDQLYSVEAQSARIAAIRQAADEAGIALFINARTDIFLNAEPAAHSAAHLEAAIMRAAAYAEAGANGFFAPGLADAALIEALCEQVLLPVNIMLTANTPPLRQMAQLGVARISYGPGPYRQVMSALKEAGRAALALL